MLAMDADLKVRLPGRLAEALRRAARRQLTSKSELTRRILLEQLRRDGVLVELDTTNESEGKS